MARLHCARVERHSGIARAVAVNVHKPQRGLLCVVDLPVAVLVDLVVADVECAGLDCRNIVVAVVVVANVAVWHTTVVFAVAWVTKTVLVLVATPTAHESFIHLVVAVVVEQVAHLGCAWMDLGVAVVAITGLVGQARLDDTTLHDFSSAEPVSVQVAPEVESGDLGIVASAVLRIGNTVAVQIQTTIEHLVVDKRRDLLTANGRKHRCKQTVGEQKVLGRLHGKAPSGGERNEKNQKNQKNDSAL